MFEQMLQAFMATLHFGDADHSELMAQAMIGAGYDFLWARHGEVATLQMMEDYIANVRAVAAMPAEERPIGVALN